MPITEFELIKVCTPVSSDMSAKARRIAIEENPENAIPELDAVLESAMDENPDDIVSVLSTSLRSGQDSEGLRLALTAKKKWKPGRTLRVRFLDGDPVVHAKIKHYAKKWSQYANITFDFGSDPNAEIRVSCQLGKGSWSALGTDALLRPNHEPTMNYGWLTRDSSDATYSDVVLHEFGHALGCIHEHQHPEVGIPWDKSAVYRYFERTNGWSKERVDHNIFRTVDRDSTQFSQFDPKSIMIYSIPNELTIGDFEVGRNTQLSSTDKQFIRHAYPPNQSLNGIFQIQSKYSSKYLDLSLADGPDTANGTNVHQWDWHGGDNQKWILLPQQDGTYQIQSHHSEKCLDISLANGSETANGTNVHQWDWHGGNNQKWILLPQQDGTYQIQSHHSGKCLALCLPNGLNTDNGTNVHQWDWHGGDNQRWLLHPIR